MDFTVIKRAGMSQLEFAKLVGVSRVTTNLWVRCKMTPHRYIKPRIASVLLSMECAIENRDLPISEATPPAKRHDCLKNAVLSAADRLKHKEAALA